MGRHCSVAGSVGGRGEGAEISLPREEKEECGLGGVFPPNPHFYMLENDLRVGPLIFFTGLRV